MNHTVGNMLTFSFFLGTYNTTLKYTLYELAGVFKWLQASRLFGTCQGIRDKA
jgi:hypothetical protein